MANSEATQADFDTYKKLLERDLDQAATLQGRAKAWLPALTAIAALAATVTILKGPEAAKDLNPDMRTTVAFMVTAALILLIAGLVFAYRAAFGSPVDLKKLDVARITGLYERYVEQLETERVSVGQSFGAGLFATIAGTALLFGAQALTWFPPATEDNSTSYCLNLDSENPPTQVKVDADSIDMSKLADGVTIANCE